MSKSDFLTALVQEHWMRTGTKIEGEIIERLEPLFIEAEDREIRLALISTIVKSKAPIEKSDRELEKAFGQQLEKRGELLSSEPLSPTVCQQIVANLAERFEVQGPVIREDWGRYKSLGHTFHELLASFGHELDAVLDIARFAVLDIEDEKRYMGPGRHGPGSMSVPWYALRPLSLIFSAKISDKELEYAVYATLKLGCEGERGVQRNATDKYALHLAAARYVLCLFKATEGLGRHYGSVVPT